MSSLRIKNIQFKIKGVTNAIPVFYDYDKTYSRIISCGAKPGFKILYKGKEITKNEFPQFIFESEENIIKLDLEYSEYDQHIGSFVSAVIYKRQLEIEKDVELIINGAKDFLLEKMKILEGLKDLKLGHEIKNNLNEKEEDIKEDVKEEVKRNKKNGNYFSDLETSETVNLEGKNTPKGEYKNREISADIVMQNKVSNNFCILDNSRESSDFIAEYYPGESRVIDYMPKNDDVLKVKNKLKDKNIIIDSITQNDICKALVSKKGDIDKAVSYLAKLKGK